MDLTLSGERRMQTNLYILSLFLGVVLAVHLAMNGEVGKKMDNPQVANAVFWCIGALTAVIIGLTGWQSGALAPLGQVNKILLTAGMMGACLVFAIAWLGPQIGWGNLMITLLAGQVITGIMMSHFGWLGSPQQPITMVKIIGIVIMIAGVVLTTWSSASSASGNTPLN
jgi:transporter family-2 protein